MINLQDKSYCPTLEEISRYINNPAFDKFCSQIKEQYNCTEKIEFSSCSMERGWNIKFKKSGKTLCTIYPRESYFTAMLVIGPKQKDPFESLLPDCCLRLQEIYKQTQEGNGQKWLMVDLEDVDDIYRDALHIIEIRKSYK